MMISVDATFEGGVLKPKQPLKLDEGADVKLVIRTADEVIDPLEGLIGICDSPTAPVDSAENHDRYLYRDPLEGLIGICEGPGISLAERHDEILYGMTKQDANRR